MVEKRIENELYTIEFKKPEEIDAVIIGTVGHVEKDGKKGCACSSGFIGKGGDCLEVVAGIVKNTVAQMAKSGMKASDIIDTIGTTTAVAVKDGLFGIKGEVKEFVKTEGSELN